jgi:hypothetical protein
MIDAVPDWNRRVFLWDPDKDGATRSVGPWLDGANSIEFEKFVAGFFSVIRGPFSVAAFLLASMKIPGRRLPSICVLVKRGKTLLILNEEYREGRCSQNRCR